MNYEQQVRIIKAQSIIEDMKSVNIAAENDVRHRDGLSFNVEQRIYELQMKLEEVLESKEGKPSV